MTRQARTPVEKPFQVLPSHERVLAALGRYDRLTAEQTKRLLFGDGSLTYVQTKCKELADAGYILRVPVGRPVPHGSGPYVYSLDRRGRVYLGALGMDVPGRLRQSEEFERSSPLLRHSIAAVDVLILCELLCRKHSAFALAGMMGERALKGRQVAVTVPDGTQKGVATDAWVDLRITHPGGGVEQLCLAFEVDNGTEWQAAWRRKVAALLAYDRGPYMAAFGVETLTIAVVAPDEARCGQLRMWTEQEIIAEHAGAQADLFRFGTMPADLADAPSFFLTPTWSTPGEPAVVPLIEGIAR